MKNGNVLRTTARELEASGVRLREFIYVLRSLVKFLIILMPHRGKNVIHHSLGPTEAADGRCRGKTIQEAPCNVKFIRTKFSTDIGHPKQGAEC